MLFNKTIPNENLEDFSLVSQKWHLLIYFKSILIFLKLVQKPLKKFSPVKRNDKQPIQKC